MKPGSLLVPLRKPFFISERPQKHFLPTFSPRLVISSTRGLHLLYPRTLHSSHRHFLHTTVARHQDEQPITTFSDPERSELFYHLLNPPNSISNEYPVYAVSFLPYPPPTPASATILGWLPAQNSTQNSESGLNDFVENSKVSFILHNGT